MLPLHQVNPVIFQFELQISESREAQHILLALTTVSLHLLFGAKAPYFHSLCPTIASIHVAPFTVDSLQCTAEWWLPNKTSIPSMTQHHSPDPELRFESRIPLPSAEDNTKTQ